MDWIELMTKGGVRLQYNANKQVRVLRHGCAGWDLTRCQAREVERGNWVLFDNEWHCVVGAHGMPSSLPWPEAALR